MANRSAFMATQTYSPVTLAHRVSARAAAANTPSFRLKNGPVNCHQSVPTTHQVTCRLNQELIPTTLAIFSQSALSRLAGEALQHRHVCGGGGVDQVEISAAGEETAACLIPALKTT